MANRHFRQNTFLHIYITLIYLIYLVPKSTSTSFNDNIHKISNIINNNVNPQLKNILDEDSYTSFKKCISQELSKVTKESENSKGPQLNLLSIFALNFTRLASCTPEKIKMDSIDKAFGVEDNSFSQLLNSIEKLLKVKSIQRAVRLVDYIDAEHKTNSQIQDPCKKTKNITIKYGPNSLRYIYMLNATEYLKEGDSTALKRMFIFFRDYKTEIYADNFQFFLKIMERYMTPSANLVTCKAGSKLKSVATELLGKEVLEQILPSKAKTDINKIKNLASNAWSLVQSVFIHHRKKRSASNETVEIEESRKKEKSFGIYDRLTNGLLNKLGHIRTEDIRKMRLDIQARTLDITEDTCLNTFLDEIEKTDKNILKSSLTDLTSVDPENIKLEKCELRVEKINVEEENHSIKGSKTLTNNHSIKLSTITPEILDCIEAEEVDASYEDIGSSSRNVNDQNKRILTKCNPPIPDKISDKVPNQSAINTVLMVVSAVLLCCILVLVFRIYSKNRQILVEADLDIERPNPTKKYFFRNNIKLSDTSNSNESSQNTEVEKV